jgi:hypothetical protein
VDIEETVQRESYRDFDLVLLSRGKTPKLRWHITHKESGMNRSYGYAISQTQAHVMIDAVLKNHPT